MKPQHRTELIVGIFVIIAIGIVMVLIVQMGDRFFVRQYKVTAYFEDAAGLKPGVTVTLAGVPIGRVSSLRLLGARELAALGRSGTLVRVSVTIDYAYDIPDGSALVLSKTAILGEQELTFIPSPSKAHLPKDGTAVVANTRAPLGPTEKVSQAIDELQTSLREFLARLNKIIGDEQFQADLKSSMANLADLTKRSGRLVDNLAAASESADAFLASAQDLLENSHLYSVLRHTDSLAATLDKSLTADELSETIGNINSSANSFSRLAGQLADTLEQERGLFATILKDRELGAEVKQTVKELRGSAAELEVLLPRVTAAADELRSLGIFLQNYPSSIIFGRPGALPTPYVPPPID